MFFRVLGCFFAPRGSPGPPGMGPEPPRKFEKNVKNHDFLVIFWCFLVFFGVLGAPGAPQDPLGWPPRPPENYQKNTKF